MGTYMIHMMVGPMYYIDILILWTYEISIILVYRWYTNIIDDKRFGESRDVPLSRYQMGDIDIWHLSKSVLVPYMAYPYYLDLGDIDTLDDIDTQGGLEVDLTSSKGDIGVKPLFNGI